MPGALCKIKDVRAPVKTAFSETTRYTYMLVYLSNFVVILKLWQVIQTLRSFWCILIICPPSICLLCSTSYVWRTFLLADKMTTKFCFESTSILSCIKSIMLVLTSYCSSWSVTNWSTSRPKEPKVPRRTSSILQSAPAARARFFDRIPRFHGLGPNYCLLKAKESNIYHLKVVI